MNPHTKRVVGKNKIIKIQMNENFIPDILWDKI